MSNIQEHVSDTPTAYVTITSDKSKSRAIILCLIGFIGIAGLQRFYVGKIFTGILYLLSYGFFGIGTVIDLIQLLMGQYTDNVGQPLRR